MRVLWAFRTVLLVGYFAYVFYGFVKFLRTVKTANYPFLRSRVGSTGLMLGILSAAAFAWFYVYTWVTGTLPLHGSALLLLMLVGEALAAAGIVLGLFERGWMRQAAFFISGVAALLWFRDGASSSNGADIIDAITVILLMAYFFYLVWGGYVGRHTAKS